MIHRTLTVVLKPTEAQEQQFLNFAGASRFVWNRLIDIQNERIENNKGYLGSFDLGRLIVSWKQEPETSWLYEISHHTLLEVARQNAEAYRTYFSRRNGKPRYKSRKHSEAKFFSRPERFHFNPDDTLHLDKLGNIAYSSRLKDLTKLNGAKIIRVTIKKRCSKWVALIGLVYKSHINTPEAGSMGIDVGVHNLVTAYWDGNTRVYSPMTSNKAYKKANDRLNYLNRVLTRKLKFHVYGTSYSRKLSFYLSLVQRAYQKQHFRRIDYNRKIVAELLSYKPSRVVMETLDIHEMQEDIRTSKYMLEVSLGECIKTFRAACEWRGIPFVQARADFPSTQICSSCGSRQRLTLADRIYNCKHCGITIDRDVNAAKNLSKWCQ